MPRIAILDPTAPPPGADAGPGPDAGSLEGRTVGIRIDRAWKSFEWVSDEWAEAFRRAGAKVKIWVAGNRVGDEGARTRAELDAFAESVDLAVVGLGN